MTKKQRKAKNNLNRVMAPFNTGIRTMKSAKDYRRYENRVDTRNLKILE